MLEFRFVVPAGTHVSPPIPRLQWRTKLIGIPTSAAYVNSQWTDWMDVPVVALPNVPDKQSED